MPGAVGITTDLIRGRKHWERTYPASLRNWRVVEMFHTRSEAQAYERQLSRAWGCDSQANASGPESAVWFVYYFDHDNR